MRWIAAFAVAAFHAGLLHSDQQSPYLAVDFFFALSGFVIAHAYDARLAGGMSAKEFIGRRLLRLYPLFALGLVLGLVAALVEIGMGVGQDTLGITVLQFLCGLLFLPYPSLEPNALISPLNGPYWSLILEIHINVIFALAFAWLSLRVISVMVAVSGLVLVGIAYAATTLETGYLVSDYFGGVARVGFSFSAGILLSRLRRRVTLPHLHWAVVLAAAGILLVLPRPIELRWIYDLVCVILLFPMLILLGAQSQPSSPRVIRIFVLGGGASYALYAIHTPIFHFGHLFAEANHDIPYRIVMLPFLVIACIAAVVADLFYDQPVRRWLSARLERARAAPKPRPRRSLPVE